MKIILARHSGFCMGVRRAVRRVVQEIDRDAEVHVYGELIHNPQAIYALSKKGMKTITNIDETDGRAVAIRTHGVPLETGRLIKSRASRVINLTCPRVARVQSIIKKYASRGYHTIITGDSGHAEMAGLISYASSGYTVIGETGPLPPIPSAEKYLLVSQTTFNCEAFEKITERLSGALNGLVVINTICESTGERQDEVREQLEQGIDTLVVVGGKNSANTGRLAHLGTARGVRTISVEDQEELVASDFSSAKKVLVAAGASTPGWIINNVLNRLFEINIQNSLPMLKPFLGLMEKILRFNVLISITGYFVSMGALRYIYSSDDRLLPLLASFYVFSMYSIYNYMELEHFRFSHPYRFSIYEKYGGKLCALSILLFPVSLVLTLQYPFSVTAAICALYVTGFLYSIEATRLALKKITGKFFNYVYFSKTAPTAGWLLITVILPMLVYDYSAGRMALYALFVFCFISTRSILNDTIAYQGDMILGRGSIPTWAGIKIAVWTAFFLSVAGIASLGLLAGDSGKPAIFLISACFLYSAVFAVVLGRRRYLVPLQYEFALEFNQVLFICSISLLAAFS